MIRRAVALAVALLILPAPAGAQEPAEREDPIRDLVFRVEELVFRVQSVGQVHEESASETRFVLEADVLFAFDRATLRPRARRILQEVAREIEEEARGRVRIAGHTDSIGTDAYNQNLSERRAAAVERFLERLVDAPGVRLVSRAFGETRPVAPNTNPDGSDNPEGRARNRRVEITFSK